MNICLVPVTTEMLSKDVGGEALLTRCCRYADDVRDIDRRILVACEDPLPEQIEVPDGWQLVGEDPNLAVSPLPAFIHHFGRTLPRSEENVFLAINPAFPFVSRAKWEQALYSVWCEEAISALSVGSGWHARPCGFTNVVRHGVVGIDAFAAMHGKLLAGVEDPGNWALGKTVQYITLRGVELMDARYDNDAIETFAFAGDLG